MSTLKNLKTLRIGQYKYFNHVETLLKRIDSSQMTELHIDESLRVSNQNLMNIMARKWPNLKVFRLIGENRRVSKDVVDVILEKCPMLQVLILPWFISKTSLTDEYMYRLLTQKRVKLSINYWQSGVAFKKLKKYEVHHVPSKQWVFSDDITQDFCISKASSEFRQRFVYIDQDIFGIKSKYD